MSVTTSKNFYEEHFGLLEFPFGITPNPRFSYSTSLYREAFATLRYGIEARKGFILITGEVGTGKTTLLRAFMHSVEPTVHAAFIFNPKLSFSQLVGSVLADLGVTCSSRDRLTLIEKLNDYLLEQFKKDHIVALLVDEAQNLSDEMLEELRLLSNLETDKNRLLQIVLTGQPEFERRLDQPNLRQLKQRIALRCRLTPLARDEVGPYIDHRLRKAGYQGKPLFEADAVERISVNSQGIPRLINVICDNALLTAYTSSKKKVSAEIIEEVTRDLELAVPSTAQRIDSQRPVRAEVPQAEIHRDEPRVSPVFDEFFIEGQPPELYPKRKAKKPAQKILLGLVVALMIGLGTGIYSQQDRDLVSDIAARLEDFSRQSGNYISDMDYLSDLPTTMSAQFQKSRDAVSAIAVKMEDYLHESGNYLSQISAEMRSSLNQGREFLSGLAAKAKSSIATEGESLKPVDLIPRHSQDSRPNNDVADSLDRTPSDSPTPVAEESWFVKEPSEEPELDKAETVPGTKEIAKAQTPTTPATAREGENPSARKDHSTTQPTESQMPRPESEGSQFDPQITSKREPPTLLGNFEVVQDSFLRDKPGSAATITVLPPGTRIRVERRDGDYFRVRSLDEPELRGYVHREDAFFEQIR